MTKYLIAVVMAVAVSGCGSVHIPLAFDRPSVQTTPRPVELPVVNIPRSMREWNWGGGSCVHASTVMHFRWHNAQDLATFWRKTYAGGESYSGLTNKLQRNKIPFYSVSGGRNNDVAEKIESAQGFIRELESDGHKWFGTFDGNVDVLERCTRERRGGVIFYYPNHSILFCGFGPSAFPGIKGEQAHLLDNNRIEKFIEVPKAEFINNWRGYGGVCVVPTIGSPRPPLPYISAR